MDIVGIFDVLDTEKQGFISLDVVQSFIEQYKSNAGDSQVGNLDEFSNILLTKAHPDGHLYVEDFEAAVRELESTYSQKSPQANLTPTGSVELQSSQETLAESNPQAKPRQGWNARVLEKSPSIFSKDDSNDTHSDSGVQDCVNSLDQVIADNEDEQSIGASPRGTQHVRGSSFGTSLHGEVTDNEEYEDYGESENDYSLRSGDGPPCLSGPPLPSGGSPPSSKLLKPPPHPGSSSLKESPRGTWPRRRQSYAGPWGPLSATRQARDLYSSSLNGSPYSSYSEGLCADVSIGHFEDIQDQIFALKNQFSSLSSTQLESTQKQNRLADENQLLHLQVNSLEEQLRDVESKSVGGLDSEKRQLRERMERLDRDRTGEITELRKRLHLLETESAEARLEATRFKSEAERLKLEKIRAEERLEDAERHVSSLREERERYLDIHRRELECLKKERDHANLRLEEICSRQYEDGRYRSSSSLSSGGADVRHSELMDRFKEAQELVKRLTKENKGLREQLEETQAELLTRTLEQGRSLVQRSESSLAAELESCTKDESKAQENALDALCDSGAACGHAIERKKLMEMLVREKDANQKLRGYIDNILTRIMEKNPAILEV